MFSSTLAFPAVLVHAASLCYVIALMIRDQLILRAFILLGTGFYIAYYYFAADIPLWEAIFWSALMGAVNIYVMVDMILERTTFSMTEEEKSIYPIFRSLSPGQFRKVMKIAEWRTADKETILTTEGEHNEFLYFIVVGPCHANRNGKSFSLSESCFIGEISMLLRSPASATTIVVKGGRYICWNRSDFEELQERNPAMAVGLSTVLKIDLASKVAKSVRI